MNLAEEKKERHGRRWPGFLLAGVLLLGGIGVPLRMVSAARSRYLETEESIRILEQELKGYDQVLERYLPYDDTMISSQERQLPDRTEMLEVIWNCFSRGTEILSIQIEDNRAAVSGMHEDLQSLSGLVEQLRREKIVEDVSVSSARTQESSGKTSAEIVITFQKEGDST